MEMLTAIIFEESGQFTAAVQHDLESFCWVALWAILKNPPSRPEGLPRGLWPDWEKHAEFRWKRFRGLFGPREINSIVDSRGGLFVLARGQKSRFFLEGQSEEIDSLSRLCTSVCGLLHKSVILQEGLTYDQILAALGEHICLHVSPSLNI
jgi:hypothetical protein